MRRAAAHKAMRDHDISQRRACRLVHCLIVYFAAMHEGGGVIRRPSGVIIRRRIQKFAKRSRRLPTSDVGLATAGSACGWNAKEIMNHKKLYRPYTKEKLGVKRRKGPKVRGGDHSRRCQWVCSLASVGYWALCPIRLARPLPGSGLLVNHERDASYVCWL